MEMRFVVFLLYLHLTWMAAQASELTVPVDKGSERELEGARTIAQEAVRQVVAVYEQDGINAALAQADALLEKLANTAYAIEPGRRHIKPDMHMRLVMWREAQVRTGREDPLWGLRIFQWLDRPGGLGSSRNKTGPLYANMLGRMHEVGLLGEAHLLVLEMENSLKSAGLNTLIGEAPDLGPWSVDASMIRKRPFPVHVPDRGNRSPRLYGFTYFLAMGNIASQAFIEGDWQRAAELYLWIRTYADSYLEANPDAVTGSDNQSYETLYSYQNSTIELAKILELNGQFAPALELLDEMLDRNYRPYDGCSHFYAQFYREYLQMKLGQSDTGALERAAHIYDAFCTNTYADIGNEAQMTVFYSQLLRFHGKLAAAWEILNRFESELDARSLTPKHTIRLGRIRPTLYTFSLLRMYRIGNSCRKSACCQMNKLLLIALPEIRTSRRIALSSHSFRMASR